MVKEFISQLPPDKLSPLLARPKGEGYELVSGHRRRLAAQKLGLPTVPPLLRFNQRFLKAEGMASRGEAREQETESKR